MFVSEDLDAGLGPDGWRSRELRSAPGASSEAFINPSLTLLDGRLVVAARLHRWPQNSLHCDLRREVRFSQFSGGTLMEESMNGPLSERGTYTNYKIGPCIK